jgi:hypothetical protein
MRHTVTGLVTKPVEAQQIIEELLSRCLCDRSDITLIAQDTAGQPSRMVAGAARAAGQLTLAATSAAATTFSAMVGIATEVGRQAPGFGALSAAGRLGTALSKAAMHTAEDVAQAFISFGVEQDVARTYADALRVGHILVVVDAKTDAMASCARQIFASHGAVTPETHAAHP